MFCCVLLLSLVCTPAKSCSLLLFFFLTRSFLSSLFLYPLPNKHKTTKYQQQTTNRINMLPIVHSHLLSRHWDAPPSLEIQKEMKRLNEKKIQEEEEIERARILAEEEEAAATKKGKKKKQKKKKGKKKKKKKN